MITKFQLSRETPWSAEFEVEGSEGTHEITIKILKSNPIFDVSSCPCKFGSFYGHSKKNRREGKICTHLRECLDLLEHLIYINDGYKKETKL